MRVTADPPACVSRPRHAANLQPLTFLLKLLVTPDSKHKTQFEEHGADGGALA
jgi:hypothetical protein